MAATNDRLIKDLPAIDSPSGDDFIPAQSGSSDSAGRVTFRQIVSAGLPAFTTSDNGKALTIKTDGTGTEWHRLSDLDFNIATLPHTSPTLHDDSILSGSFWTFDPDTYEPVPAPWAHVILDGMTDAGKIDFTQVDSLETFSAASLLTVKNFSFTQCPNLTQINARNLDQVDTFGVYDCNKIQRIEAVPREAFSFFGIGNNPELTFVGMNGIRRVGDIQVANNPKLKSLQFTSMVFIGGSIELSGNGLSNVNAILNTIATEFDGKSGKQLWGGPGKYINLSGGTNAAPTDDEPFYGITSAKTLIARGATVTLNGPAITTTNRMAYLPEYNTATDVSKTLAVKADGTGTEWKAGSSTATTLAGGTFANIVYQENAGNTRFIPTPQDDGRVLYCGGLASGTIPPFQWVSCAIVPPATVANASKVLTVKADGTGTEWASGGMKSVGIYPTANLEGTATLSLTLPRWCNSLTIASTTSQITHLQINNLEIYDAISFSTTYLDIKDFPKLVRPFFPDLRYCGQIRFRLLPEMTEIRMNLIRNWGSFIVEDCPKLTTLTFTNRQDDSWGVFRVTGAPLLTSPGVLTACKFFRKSIYLIDCAISLVNVEALLADLVLKDGTNYDFMYGKSQAIQITGGTSAGLAALSAAAIANKDTLVARGCTVTLNP